MTKSVLLTTAIVFALAAAPSEASQAPFELDLSMAPKTVGTKSEPEGIRLDGRLRFRPPDADDDSPTVTAGTLLLPSAIEIDGDRYASCGKRKVSSGIAGCPARSIMGGTRDVSRLPDFGSRPSITFVNGGARRIWALTTYYNPALVQGAVRIDVMPRRRGGKRGERLTFETPSKLLAVAGIPIAAPEHISFSIGGRPYARRYVVTKGRCPARGFMRYSLILSLRTTDGVTSTQEHRGRLDCR
jgi:hypothetical protein